MILAPGDVVWVPFPHVEDNRLRPRPALIVSQPVGPDGMLCWALMITNAARDDWPGDVPIEDYAALGLPIPSKIRTAKIATLEQRAAAKLGRLPDNVFATVRDHLRRNLPQA